jgi:Inner membrane component of T3SS, cytoplasmic domain
VPVDVLEVTGGQDRGARFALLGSEATIGRGPVMDMVLTDPAVSERHARLRLSRGSLLVEDLGSGARTAVNDVAVSAPIALARGDRVALGRTEMTVLWTPGAQPPAPARPSSAPAPAAPPPAPSAPPPRAARTQPVDRGRALLAAACLLAGLVALAATWMPAVGTPLESRSVWDLSAAIRAQALLTSLVACAAAGAWLAAELSPARASLRAPLAVATCAGGGFVAGLPFFLAAADLGLAAREAAVPVLGLAALAVVACALAALARADRRPPLRAPEPLLAAAGGIVGAALVVAGAPLDWFTVGTLTLSGFGGGLGAGRWLLPVGLALAATSAATAAAAMARRPATALLLAAAAVAISAAVLTFATTAVAGFSATRIEIGLSLILTGAAVALTTTVMGAIALATRSRAA